MPRTRRLIGRLAGLLTVSLSLALIIPQPATADDSRSRDEGITQVAPAIDKTGPDLARLGELTAALQSPQPPHAFGAPGGSQVAVAQERATLFQALIEQDPAAALAQAIPATVRATMPKELQPFIEEQSDLTGSVKSLVAFGGQLTAEAHYHLLLRDGQPALSLHFATAAEEHLMGAISLTGLRSGTKVAVASYNLQPAEAPRPYPISPRPRKTAVFPMNFPENRVTPFDQAQLSNVVFNTANPDSVSSWLKATSGNKVSLEGISNQTGGDIFPWYNSFWPSNTCDVTDAVNWANDVLDHYASQAPLTSYDHWIVAIPRTNSCSWAGLALLDDKISWYNDYYGLATDPSAGAGVMTHELGHNFGLDHAAGLNCPTGTGWVSISDSCIVGAYEEYRDPYDTMGDAVNRGRYGVANLIRLGWLPAEQVQTVSKPGTYRIATLGGSGSGAQALKIARPSALKYTDWGRKMTMPVDYYLEYRQPAPPETWAAETGAYTGVTVRLRGRDKYSRTYLIDTTPDTAAWTDSPLAPGGVFADCTAKMRITTLAADATGATVKLETNLTQPQFIRTTAQLGDGAPVSTSSTLPLTFQAHSDCGTVTQYRYTQGGTAWSPWQSYTGPVATTVTLPSGDGLKTVKVEVKDSTKAVAALELKVNLDRTGPTGTININHGQATTAAESTVSLSAQDVAGVTEMHLSADNQTWTDWEPYAAEKGWTFTGKTGDTVKVWAQFKDGLGNVGAALSDQALLDLDAPVVSLQINGGAPKSNSGNLALTLKATDTPAGPGQMRFSLDGATWGAWLPFRTSAPYPVNVADGPVTVYAQVQDKAGNLATPVTASIELDRTPPTLTAASVNGLNLTLTWSEPLATRISVEGLQVTVAGKANSVSVPRDGLNGATLTLRLNSPVLPGQAVAIGLKKGAVSDQVSNANLTAAPVTVTNLSESPVLQQLVVTETSLSVIYDRELDPASLPSASDLRLVMNDKPVTLRSPVINGTTLRFTLGTSARQGAEFSLSYKQGSKRLQDRAGNPAAAFTNNPVLNQSQTGDGYRPALQTATIDGTMVLLTYDKALSTSAKPNASAFAFVINGARPVAARSITIIGNQVYLALPRAVTDQDSVQVAYTLPSTGLQDLVGNSAAAFSQAATWAPTTPTVVGATATTRAITLTFSEALSASTPRTGDFAVTLNGAPVTVSSVRVQGSQVILTLRSAVPPGSPLHVVYTPGSSPLKDLGGNPTGPWTQDLAVPQPL